MRAHGTRRSPERQELDQHEGRNSPGEYNGESDQSCATSVLCLLRKGGETQLLRNNRVSLSLGSMTSMSDPPRDCALFALFASGGGGDPLLMLHRLRVPLPAVWPLLITVHIAVAPPLCPSPISHTQHLHCFNLSLLNNSPNQHVCCYSSRWYLVRHHQALFR